MAEQRCEKTDLLTSMCAHCLGHTDFGQIDPGTVEVTTQITAGYDGPCALNGRHRIEPGDVIGATEHGWACTNCTRKVVESRG